MLSSLSQVFDNILYTIVFTIFVKHSIFLLEIKSISGKKKRKTELLGISLLDKLLTAQEEGNNDVCVFIDYSACFDTLTPSILCHKLER